MIAMGPRNCGPTASSSEVIIILRLGLLQLGEDGCERILRVLGVVVQSITTALTFVVNRGGEELVTHLMLQIVGHVRLEEPESIWKADEDELGDVDLHEDEELMKCTEDVADRGHVDPFVAVEAEKMLVRAWLHLLVNDEVAGGDSKHREHTEEDVGDEEELGLLLEELFVELELVLLHWWQVLVVNHVAMDRKVYIVTLVNQND